MKNNRSLKNILRQPRKQLSISIVFVTTITILFCLFALWNLSSLQGTVEETAKQYNVAPDAMSQINYSFSITMVATAFFGVCAVIAGATMGFSISHRLFGPLVPIRQLIAKLKEGQFSARGSLRKNDEYQDIMNDLNELAASLEKRG